MSTAEFAYIVTHLGLEGVAMLGYPYYDIKENL
jgi:hypothetical protein